MERTCIHIYIYIYTIHIYIYIYVCVDFVSGFLFTGSNSERAQEGLQEGQ